MVMVVNATLRAHLSSLWVAVARDFIQGIMIAVRMQYLVGPHNYGLT